MTSSISGDLDFTFTGYKVNLEYVFTCHDENEAEAESFSEYCLNYVRDEFEKLGYCIEKISCEVQEADMDWLDKMEDAIFGPRM